VQKVQDVVADKFRKDDKLRKKTKVTKNTDKESLDQEVTDDEVEASADGDENGGVRGEELQEQVKLLLMREVLVKVSVTNTHTDEDSSSQVIRIHFKLFRGYSRRTTERGGRKVVSLA
jgi:hypothetical protein